MEREDLMNRLKFETNVFAGRGIEAAFAAIDRQDFLEEDYKPEAYEDYAVPLGHGASMTQPTTLAFMLEMLDVQLGDSVLDVGSGSGFSTALLSHLAGETGKVLGLEIVLELLEKSKKNVEKYNMKNIAFALGESENVPDSNITYDRILVGATSKELPGYLLDKLSVGGTIVVPVEDEIVVIKKISSLDFDDQRYGGFVFDAMQ